MNRKSRNKMILSGETCDIRNSSGDIFVTGDVTLNAIDQSDWENIDITLDKGAHLTFNIFDFHDRIDHNISISAESNSKFKINASFIATGEYNLSVDIVIVGDNTEGTLSVRGINELSGKTHIDMTGTIKENTRGNVLNEYAHILNKSENANVVVPKLMVNTNEVEANHGVTIGHLDEKEIFYLMCKGLDIKEATRMIERGFILADLDVTTKEKINKLLR